MPNGPGHEKRAPVTLAEVSASEQWARIVGGPMDGESIAADEENPWLPESFCVDGGNGPVGYRLVRAAAGTELSYVHDDRVADAYMKELWGDDPPVERRDGVWVHRERHGSH